MSDGVIVRNEVSYVDDGSDLKVVPPVGPVVSSDVDEALLKLVSNAQNAVLSFRKPDDYFVGGILYCGNCKTPKSHFVERFGKQWLVAQDCECRAQLRLQEEKELVRRRKNVVDKKFQADFMYSERMKNCYFSSWTYSSSTYRGMEEALRDKLLRYVSSFDKVLARGIGLYLYGGKGVGKSFAAACIVNALSDKGYSCLMTNFTSIYNLIWSAEGRQSVLNRLKKYDLVVLDDLGTEYDNDYSRSLLFEMIDSFYRDNRLLIVTSNVEPDLLRKASSDIMQRAWSRLFEMCHPLVVKGVDRRAANFQSRFSEINLFLDGLQDLH